MRIIASFDSQPDPDGAFMYDCHILQEDAGMMGQFVVAESTATALPTAGRAHCSMWCGDRVAHNMEVHMPHSGDYHGPVVGWVIGGAAALILRAAFVRGLQMKLRRDVARLNAGDHRSLLAAYRDDAVLNFNQGPHRWSGPHRGKPAIDRFLRNFIRARLQGEIRGLWVGGPPWALTLVARFDDRAPGADGADIYANRAVLVARTRWGRITEQDDFYEDTRRIDAFERTLTELGVQPIAAENASGRTTHKQDHRPDR